MAKLFPISNKIPDKVYRLTTGETIQLEYLGNRLVARDASDILYMKDGTIEDSIGLTDIVLSSSIIYYLYEEYQRFMPKIIQIGPLDYNQQKFIVPDAVWEELYERHERLGELLLDSGCEFHDLSMDLTHDRVETIKDLFRRNNGKSKHPKPHYISVLTTAEGFRYKENSNVAVATTNLCMARTVRALNSPAMSAHINGIDGDNRKNRIYLAYPEIDFVYVSEEINPTNPHDLEKLL